MTVTLHLDQEDDATLHTISEVFYYIRRLNLTDGERRAFGRVLANEFCYSDVESVAECLKTRCSGPCDDPELEREFREAKRLVDAFLRDLWNDLRTHHLGGVLVERFGGGVVPASN